MSAEARLLEEVEISLLLEGIYRVFGIDFRNYAYPYVRKRIRRFCQREGLSNASELQVRVLHEESCLKRFVDSMTISSVSMFNEPDFYIALREEVIPTLKKAPLIRIWQAGCSTGQEAYSLAILLEEEGIYDKCRIYATDPNEGALKRAKSGFLPISAMKQYTENYVNAGGNKSFSEYYTANYDGVRLDPALKRNMIFGKHNLATDGFFNEFHLIILRNVLVCFNPQLREQVLHLIHESLSLSGILALGKFESLSATSIEKSYKKFLDYQKLYRRFCA